MDSSTVCANCAEVFKSAAEICSEIMVQKNNVTDPHSLPTWSRSTSKSKLVWKSMKVKEVLSTLFQLDYLEKFANNNNPPQQQQEQNEEEVLICKDCSALLLNLYTLHTYFASRRSSESYLTEKIGQLETLLKNLQLLFSATTTTPDPSLSSSITTTKDIFEDPSTYESDGERIKDDQIDEPILVYLVDDDNNINNCTSSPNEPQDHWDDDNSVHNNGTSNPNESEDHWDEMTIEEVVVTCDGADDDEDNGDHLNIKWPTPSKKLKISQPSVPPKKREDPYNVYAATILRLQKPKEDEPPKAYQCPRCRESFDDATQLMTHVFKQHASTQVTCPIPTCQEVVGPRDPMKKHLRRHFRVMEGRRVIGNVPPTDLLTTTSSSSSTMSCVPFDKEPSTVTLPLPTSSSSSLLATTIEPQGLFLPPETVNNFRRMWTTDVVNDKDEVVSSQVTTTCEASGQENNNCLEVTQTQTFAEQQQVTTTCEGSGQEDNNCREVRQTRTLTEQQQHLMKKPDERTQGEFKCSKCPRLTGTESELALHMLNVHVRGVCPVCPICKIRMTGMKPFQMKDHITLEIKKFQSKFLNKKPSPPTTVFVVL